MSDINVNANAADSEPKVVVLNEGEEFPYRSLPTLTEKHGELLKRYNQHRLSKTEADKGLWDEVREFIVRGCQAGFFIYDDSARWSAQSILEYWSAALFRAGYTPPDSLLLPYDEERAETLPDDACPYVGLDSFRDNRFFYGRQRLLDDMIGKLKESRLLALVGPSGSGKSSAVMGALLPALKSGDKILGSEKWTRFRPMLPGTTPLEALARLLPVPDGEDPDEWPKSQAAKLLQQPDSLPALLATLGGQPCVLVVDQFEEVFTLCENPQEAQAFLRCLLSMTQTEDLNHIVIVTMRSDYKSYINGLPDAPDGSPDAFKEVFNNGQVPATPMDSKELREAIINPATQVGLIIDEKVVDALVKDMLSETAALPLLQFTLLKLWEHRDHNRVTLRDYKRLGGGRQSLQLSADELYSQLPPQQQEVLRRILLRMVKPTQGMEFMSSRIQLRKLFIKSYAFDSVKEVLRKLAERRLVRLTGIEATDVPALVEGLAEDNIPEDVQVEVAHEALVRNWPKFVDWLAEKRAAMITHQRQEAKAQEWERLGKGDAGLLDEVQVREAEAWMNSPEALDLGYSDLLGELVKESRTALATARRKKQEQDQKLLEEQRQRATAEAERATAEAERANAEAERANAEAERANAEAERANEKAKSTRHMKYFSGALALGLLLAIGAAVIAFLQRSEAKKQSGLATQSQIKAKGNELAAQALINSREQLDLSLLLSVGAISLDRGNIAALNSLIRGLEFSPELEVILSGHKDAIGDAVITPDQTLVTVDYSGNVIHWNTKEHRVLKEIPLPPIPAFVPAIESAAIISPDGRNVALLSFNKTITLWNIESGSLKNPSVNDVQALAFSADSKKLAVITQPISYDVESAPEVSNAIHLVDVESGAVRLFRDTKTLGFRSLAFSPDGQTLAAGGSWEDSSAYLWNVATGKQRQLKYEDSKESARKLAFGLDGQSLIYGGDDGAVGVWSLVTGEFTPLISAPSTIIEIAPMPKDGANDAERFVYSDNQNNVYVQGKDLSRKRIRYTASINALTVSPDGQTIMAGGADSKVLLLSMQMGEQQFRRPFKQGLTMTSMAISPDGKTLVGTPRNFATSKNRDAVAWWKLGTQEEPKTLTGDLAMSGLNKFTRVAIADNDVNVLAASLRTDVFLWDRKSGVEGQLPGIHTKDVTSLAFTPNGQTLATSDASGAIILWDVKTGQQLRSLAGHTDSVAKLVFSPDGKTLASSSKDRSIILWQHEAGNQIVKWQEHSEAVTGIAFSPDGRMLASASADRTVRLWDVLQRKPVNSKPILTGHTGGVRSVSFNPAGNWLASGSVDETIILWDVMKREQIGVLTGQSGELTKSSAPITARTTGLTNLFASHRSVTDLAFALDGKILLSMKGGSVTVWNADPDLWIRRACNIANREFTDEEWEKFMPEKMDKGKFLCREVQRGTPTRESARASR